MITFTMSKILLSLHNRPSCRCSQFSEPIALDA